MSFFSLFAFLFPLLVLFSFPGVIFFSTITPATCCETCGLHPAFISRHFQCVSVYGLGGCCSLLTQQVLIWMHCGGFVCSTFLLLKHRKGRAAQAEGHRSDKREGAFYLPYVFGWFSEQGLCFQKANSHFKAFVLFVFWKDLFP